jgi:hypothetical protein
MSTRIQRLKPTVVFLSSKFLRLRDLGNSGLGTLGPRNFRPWEFPHLLHSNIPTSEILIYFKLGAHVVQLSPTKMMAHGRSRKVHVTFSDIIGSYPTRFLFWDFGFQEFVHQHTSFFPTNEILKLRSTHLLDPMVKLFSYDLWCRYFLGFQSFGHREFVHQHISFLPIIEIPKGFQDNSLASSSRSDGSKVSFSSEQIL